MLSCDRECASIHDLPCTPNLHHASSLCATGASHRFCPLLRLPPHHTPSRPVLQRLGSVLGVNWFSGLVRLKRGCAEQPGIRRQGLAANLQTRGVKLEQKGSCERTHRLSARRQLRPYIPIRNVDARSCNANGVREGTGYVEYLLREAANMAKWPEAAATGWSRMYPRRQWNRVEQPPRDL